MKDDTTSFGWTMTLYAGVLAIPYMSVTNSGAFDAFGELGCYGKVWKTVGGEDRWERVAW